MRDEAIRYAIGVALGAAIGALLVWRIAHDDADAVLRDWEAAATNQQAAERQRAAAINRRIEDGHAAALSELRRRLAAGWRPAIPATSGLPADRIPNAPGGFDERAGDSVPGSGGSATEVELATCAAERARLIGDGAETTLQLLTLQGWVAEVSKPKSATP